MHAAIRRYKGRDPEEVARRVNDELIPMLSELDGFVAYHVVDSGGGEITSISIFEDQAGAEKSTEVGSGWAQEELAELIDGPPEVTTGEITASAMAGAGAQA